MYCNDFSLQVCSPMCVSGFLKCIFTGYGVLFGFACLFGGWKSVCEAVGVGEGGEVVVEVRGGVEPRLGVLASVFEGEFGG